MNISNIASFIKLVEIGSISKTAIELYITQSSLSKIVNKLEDELNVKLLNRTNKGVNLTKEGQLVYNYFLKIIELEKEMKKEILDLKENVIKLKIEALPSIANYSLPCTLYNLGEKFKDIKFPLVLKNSSSKIVSDISDGIVDLGLVSTCNSCEFLKIKYTKAYEEKIVLVTCYKNKINEIDKEMLENINIIQYIGDDTIKDALELHLPNLDKIKYHMELESMEAIKKSIIHSNSYAFLPYSAIKSELYRKEIKAVKIKDVEITKEIYIARRYNNLEKHRKIIEYIEKFLLDTIC